MSQKHTKKRSAALDPAKVSATLNNSLVIRLVVACVVFAVSLILTMPKFLSILLLVLTAALASYDIILQAVEDYRLAAKRFSCPLHVGVTEAGTLIPGAVRNSVALGILLGEGIGDTIRVSLTAKPEKEVRVGMEILRALGLRAPGPAITSCPTCGRTKVDLMHVASQVEIALETLAKDGVRLPKVAVMGCAVNGPGEAKGADIALCGADGDFVLYVKGKQVCRVSEEDAVGKVVEYAVSLQ